MPYSNPPKIDLTSRDWASIINDYIKPGGYLESRFGSEYTEFRDTELGAALIELIAGVGEVFQHAVDVEANESTLLTCRQIQNAIDHAQSIGYDIQSHTASRHRILIQTPGYSPAISFAAGRRLTTNPRFGTPQIFELESEVTKPLNQFSVEAIAVSGETAEPVVYVSSGDGKSKIKLPRPGVIIDSIQVTVDGDSWTRVNNFSSSTPSDKHFRASVVEEIPGERFVFIEFGNTITGHYPPLDSTVEVNYRIGGGVVSNLPNGAIDRFESPVVDANGNPIITVVSNTEILTSASDGDTVDLIKIKGVSQISMNSRLVGNSDYENAAKLSGAIRALALTKNEWSVVEENTILLIVASSMSVATTTEQAEAIKNTMLANYPSRQSRRLLVVPCKLENFVADLTIFMRRKAVESSLRVELLQLLNSFYGIDSIQGLPPRFVVDIGKPIRLSNLIRTIETLSQVSYVRVNSPASDFEPAFNVMPLINLDNWTFSFEYDSRDLAV